MFWLFFSCETKESFRILLCKIVSTSGNDAVQDLDPVNSFTGTLKQSDSYVPVLEAAFARLELPRH
jgi:hypothetical protein